MRNVCLIILLSCLCHVSGAQLTGGELEIVINGYKDNGLQLATYESGTNADNYKSTIWIEGPYDPETPCSIQFYHRQDPKLVRVLTHYQFTAASYPGQTEPLSPAWIFEDYATPDLLAALIVSGKYYHLPDYTASYDNSVAAPVDAVRQHPQNGGIYTGAGAVIYQADPGTGDIYILGDNFKSLPDGISGSTVRAGETETFTWDMKDMDGNFVEAGHYLVYVQLSAERHDPSLDPNPRGIAWNQQVEGKEVVNIETCWDDPAYDNLGPHRVVNLFDFSGGSFEVTDENERKWSGDTYSYLNGGVTFNYTSTQAPVRGREAGRPAVNLRAVADPASGSILIDYKLLAGTNISSPCKIEILNSQGSLVKAFQPASRPGENRIIWRGSDEHGNQAPGGQYFIRLKTGTQTSTRQVTLLR